MQSDITTQFSQVVEAFQDADSPFPENYLQRFSDLDKTDVELLNRVWPDVPLERKQAFMADIKELGLQDTILSFEELARFTITDPDARVRVLSVHILWEYESRDLAGLFLDLAGNDQDAEVRAAALTGLGRFVYEGEMDGITKQELARVEDWLIQAVKNAESALERQNALVSLGYSSRPDIAGMIEESYYSENAEWVSCALYAIGRSADDRWEPLVMEKLGSSKPTVCAAAAFAAGELQINPALDRLLELVDDPDYDVRSRAIWALSQIGGEKAREKLETFYDETSDQEEKDAIGDALDNLEFWDGMDLLPFFDMGEENGSGEISLSFDGEDNWD